MPDHPRLEDVSRSLDRLSEATQQMTADTRAIVVARDRATELIKHETAAGRLVDPVSSPILTDFAAVIAGYQPSLDAVVVTYEDVLGGLAAPMAELLRAADDEGEREFLINVAEAGNAAQQNRIAIDRAAASLAEMGKYPALRDAFWDRSTALDRVGAAQATLVSYGQQAREILERHDT